jgi:GTP-binding protein
MFIDKVRVNLSAGNGGNGVVSFRHEIYVDRGGPDGGDGGDGGDIIMKASRNQNSLANFRFQKTLQAEDGGNGSKQKKHGKSGKDMVIQVPVGTVVTDEKGGELADLKEDGQEAIVAYGGKGGFGNAHFVSSVRQAPKIAEKGEPGDEFAVTLELKMIADVGLVGLPNAGKSTLISVISNAKPEIANYPFTTIKPNLGVVDVDKDTTLLFADIPGLIEGASDGKGLGDEFLRHVERTKVLVHLIDAYQNDPVGAYKTIQSELTNYKIDLSKRPQIVVLTKIEGLDEEIINSILTSLQLLVPAEVPLLAISSQSRQGLRDLLYEVKSQVATARIKEDAEKAENTDNGLPVYTLKQDEQAWKVIKRDEDWLVRGKKIERFAIRTDYESEEGVRRLKDIMRKMGIMRELEKQGIEKGQQIEIGTVASIEY